MDWQPVQGVPRLSPDDSWDRLQPPRDPTDGLDGIENGWMDVVIVYISVTSTKCEELKGGVIALSSAGLTHSVQVSYAQFWSPHGVSRGLNFYCF